MSIMRRERHAIRPSLSIFEWLRTLVAIGLLASAASLATAVPAHAQTNLENFSIAGSIAGGVGAATRDFSALMGASAQITGEIEQARREFWSAYPDAPDLPEASARFADLLWQKDQLYMAGFLIEGLPESGSYQQTPSIFDILEGRAQSLGPEQRNLSEMLINLAGGVDGGIDPEAQWHFFNWVRAVRRAMGARDDRELTLFDPFRYASALAEAHEAYERYARYRDVGEFMRGPHSPLLSDDPQEFLAGVFVRQGAPFDAAQRQAEVLEALVGPDTLGAAAAALTPDRDLTELPRSFWEGRSSVLLDALKDNVRDDPQGYIARIYMPSAPARLPETLDHIQSLFDEFGEGMILEAAERLRVAPRTLMHRGAREDHVEICTRCPLQSATWWLLHLLENPDAEIPTQAEYVVDVTNTEHMKEIMASEGKGFVGGMRFMGTVTNIEPTGIRRLAFSLANADNVVARIEERHQTPFGSRFEQLIGETVVFDAFPEVNRDQLILTISTGDILMFPVTGYLPPERLRIAEPSIQPVSELPVHQGDPVPAGSPNREDVEAELLDNLSNLFSREASSLRCDMLLDDQRLTLRHVEPANVRGDVRLPYQATIRLRLSLYEDNSPRGYVVQHFRVRDLDWHDPSLEEADGDCLVLRVPAHPGAGVTHTSGLHGESSEERQPEFSLRLTNADAAERILEAMRDYLAPHRERIFVAQSD